MSGYLNHNQFSTDYIGATSNTRDNDYNSNGSTVMNNHGVAVSGTGSANALPPYPMRGFLPTISTTAMHQPQSLLYDMSSFDPLQAQALQLSASAGLTTADILAAAAAPAGTTTDGSIGANINNAPVSRILTGVSQLAPSYSQSQAPAAVPMLGTASNVAAAPVSITGGQFQPIQPVPALAQATSAQHPYIFIQPQQLAPNAVASVGTTTFNSTPAMAAPNTLLVPTSATGVPSAHPASTAAASLAAATQAQATAVAAAAAGLGTHPLLLNPAFLTAAAAAQGVPGLAASASSGQVFQQHQPQAATQRQAQCHRTHVSTGNALGPTLILPAAINPHQAISHSHTHSKKRPLGSALMMNEIAPSVVSSATAPMTEGNKRQHVGGPSNNVNNAEDGSKTGDPSEKRRYERNLREQQRSSKISCQIKELREVLSDCNVPFKPNKYSILLKVVEYIKQLQSRAIMLDAEHQKLITTVRQTNEMITNSASNNNGMSSTTCGATDNESLDTTCQDSWQLGNRRNTNSLRGGRGDSELYFVKGIDYRGVFEQCPTAFGIAALDGRILECNVEFQNLLGYNAREDLLKQSLFNLVHNHQDIFRAMAQMLKTAEEPTSKSTSTNATSNAHGSNGTNDNSMGRFWTGPVTSKQNIKLSMNITLTSGDNGTPKFFSCALTNSVVL